jgi:uncharacterized protein (UPF0332 family)
VTDDGRRHSIADEAARAEQALDAARALLNLGLHADSVSRAYYATYHLLRALLHSRGVEPKTHAGGIHLFNTEFVRTGRLPSAHNRLLAGLQRSRELADYDAAVVFGRDDAEASIRDAESFRADVLALLRSDGWLT